MATHLALSLRKVKTLKDLSVSGGSGEENAVHLLRVSSVNARLRYGG